MAPHFPGMPPPGFPAGAACNEKVFLPAIQQWTRKVFPDLLGLPLGYFVELPGAGRHVGA